MNLEGATLARVTAEQILARCRAWYEPGVPLPVSLADLRWLRLRAARDDWYVADRILLDWMAHAVGL
jgi:hypothetical protein